MTASALLELLADWSDEAQRALRIHRHLEHRDDLLAELWLVHRELSEAAHRDLDPRDASDRDALLLQWRRRLRLDGNREARHARGLRSADAPVQADLPGLRLIDTLSATPDSDPLEALERLDAILALPLVPAEVAGTWSQPAGYLQLYERVGECLHELATLCGTGDDALLARLRRLVEVHRVQARLFDGVHWLVPGDLAPPRARPRRSRGGGGDDPQHLLWTVECNPG